MIDVYIIYVSHPTDIAMRNDHAHMIQLPATPRCGDFIIISDSAARPVRFKVHRVTWQTRVKHAYVEVIYFPENRTLMSKDRILETLDKYEKELKGFCELAPKRLSEQNTALRSSGISSYLCHSHVRWMCLETARLLGEDRRDKAMCWFGFIQGALWAMNIYSIEELNRDNMSKDETFDGDRV